MHQPPDTHQPCAVVTGEVLVADLHQAPKGLLRRTRTRREGWGQKNGAGSSPVSPAGPAPPQPGRASADLGRHVHEQHCGHGSLGLAVTLIGPVDRVGLQDSIQVLLPVGMGKGRSRVGNSLSPNQPPHQPHPRLSQSLCRINSRALPPHT